MESNKTKQSDAKLQEFMEKKRRLDKEAMGITLASERIYKELKKKLLGKDKEQMETNDKNQPVVMESDEWMNKITHVGWV
eukprot:scaffold1089_cov117-Cylindrotheca_fusiformis.AAC.2